MSTLNIADEIYTLVDKARALLLLYNTTKVDSVSSAELKSIYGQQLIYHRDLIRQKRDILLKGIKT